MCSVGVHLDPSVQAAGEHHPTDLKTGSVRSKIAALSPWKTAGSLTAIDCGERGVKGEWVRDCWEVCRLLWGCSHYCSKMCVHKQIQNKAPGVGTKADLCTINQL